MERVKNKNKNSETIRKTREFMAMEKPRELRLNLNGNKWTSGKKFGVQKVTWAKPRNGKELFGRSAEGHPIKRS